MSQLFPRRPAPACRELPHPALDQRDLDAEERRRATEVRAGYWRAHEIAEVVFGRVTRSSLSIRPRAGLIRGMLQLDVPFEDLGRHHERELAFMAAVHADPLLSGLGLVYVVGPDAV